VSEERNPVSREAEAPAYPERPQSHTISPEARAKAAELSALMRSQMDALAAAREAGRLEGLEEAAGIAEGVENSTAYAVRKVAAKRITIAIRAKLEGK